MAKKKVSGEEYRLIEEEASAAKEILEGERFKIVMEYLQSSLDYIEKSILENTIHDVRDTHTITDKLIRTFFTSKKEQVSELSGQYKFIKKFLADLRMTAEMKNDLDDAVARGKVVLDG